MTFCPNCGKQDCVLLKGPEGDLYQLEDDLNNWNESTNLEKNNIILYIAYICDDCGNFFAKGETRTGIIGNNHSEQN